MGICTGAVFITRSPLVVAVLSWTQGFCRTLPDQFCSHGSQRPMKQLSVEDIIGNAQALSLINLQSLGIAANEDTVKEMRRHYDRERAK